MPTAGPQRGGPLRTIARCGAVAMAVLVLVGAAGCSGSPTPGDAGVRTKPKVVVSTPVLGDVVRHALGDEADVEVLVPVAVDPRTYPVRAEQRQRMPDAAVVVVNGLGADPDLGNALLAVRARGHEVIEAAERLNPITTSDGTRDPHVWLDADRMTRLAHIVGDAVGPLPGVDRSAIERHVESYAAELAKADEAVQAALLPLPEGQRSLVTDRDQLGYFAERYGLRVVASVPADGAPLDVPARRSIVAAMDAAGARVILTGREPPPAAVTDVAAEAPTAVVVTLDVSTLGPTGSATDSLVGLITALGRELGRALQR